jgi:hypothetical protein
MVARRAYDRPMAQPHPAPDEPLPATMAFVLGLAVAIAVGWTAMFFLLASRW